MPRSCIRLPRLALALTGLLLAACSSDDAVGPNPDIAFLVGDWEAVRFEITPEGATDMGFDLIAEGASFTLNVQPSGQYTAVLTIPGIPSAPPELGMVTVDGGELVFHRTIPTPEAITRANYDVVDSDRVSFGGPSALDLDGNGTLDDITLEVDLAREN